MHVERYGHGGAPILFVHGFGTCSFLWREVGPALAMAAYGDYGPWYIGTAIAYEQGGYPSARALHEESLAIMRELGDREVVAVSLCSLGVVAHAQDDYTAARALYEESLAIMRELGNRSGVVRSLNGLADDWEATFKKYKRY